MSIRKGRAEKWGAPCRARSAITRGRARKQGKLCRPRLSPLALAPAATDVQVGMSKRGAPRKLGISEAALRAYLGAQMASPS